MKEKQLNEKQINKKLNDEYGLQIDNATKAEKVYNKLSLVDYLTNYEYYDFGKKNIIAFYPKILACKINEKLKCINTTGNYADLLSYEGGVYVKNNKIKEEINKRILLKDKNPVLHRESTLKELTEMTYIEYEKLNSDIDKINFKNGIYSISKNKMYKHDHRNYFTVQINCNYKVDSYNEEEFKNTLFYNFLRTSIGLDLIDIVQEIIGYTFYLGNEAQKMFCFLGAGKNGKTQFLLILNSFFNNTVRSSMDLVALQDPVRVVGIYNKFINTCGDTSSRYLEDVDFIKKLTGEDSISSNPKYRDELTFFNRAKMLFSFNTMPNTSDKTFAFIRRLIIIPFSRKITEDMKIDNLASKIISKEKDIIILWAIEGLKRLKNRKFSFELPYRCKLALEEYENDNNNIKGFIYKYCILNTDGYIPVIELKKMYKLYCYTEGMKELGNKNLKTTVSSLDIKEKAKTKYKSRYYDNISWKEDIKELIEDYENNDYKIRGKIEENLEKDEYEKIEQEGKQIEMSGKNE